MTTEATPQPPAETEPDGDQGTRTAKLVVLTLGVVITAAGLAATFWPRETRDIEWSVVSVDLSRADQVTVTFDVQKAPLAQAECQVSAFKDATGGDARQSWRLDGVVIGPSADNARVTRHRVVVPTDEQATGAAVANCVITRSH